MRFPLHLCEHYAGRTRGRSTCAALWRSAVTSLLLLMSVLAAPGYADADSSAQSLVLEAGKTMGLMVAYCDNYGSELRENVIGSERVDSGKKDRGYIDAGIFGTLTLEAAP